MSGKNAHEMEHPLLDRDHDVGNEIKGDDKSSQGNLRLRICSPGHPLLTLEVSREDTVLRLKELIEAKRTNMPKAFFYF